MRAARLGEVEEVGVEAYGAHDRFAHEVVVLFSLQVAVNAYKRTYVHTRTHVHTHTQSIHKYTQTD